MRYRALSDGDDYTIGQPFLQDSPACVLQAVITRLRLWQGEWFLDTSDGTQWMPPGILGKNAGVDPNTLIRQRILGTPNVTSIVSYTSAYDGNSRTLTIIKCVIATAFDKGAATATIANLTVG